MKRNPRSAMKRNPRMMAVQDGPKGNHSELEQVRGL